MTQDEIIRMAREAGSIDSEDVILTVYAAFAAHEREKQAEPVAYDLTTREGCTALAIEKGFERRKLHNSDVEYLVCNDTILRSFVREALAAPVRTKDLTDDEIMKINVDTAGIVPTCDRQFHFARAVIAADREKNK